MARIYLVAWWIFATVAGSGALVIGAATGLGLWWWNRFAATGVPPWPHDPEGYIGSLFGVGVVLIFVGVVGAGAVLGLCEDD